jgi:hypothetical protein
VDRSEFNRLWTEMIFDWDGDDTPGSSEQETVYRIIQEELTLEEISWVDVRFLAGMVHGLRHE